jgi:CPA2 family monovalent cation:H+ antiporter-2
MAFPWKVAMLAGAGLAQFGEFGYILLESGKYNGLISDREMAVLLAAGCISMFFAPVAARITPRFLAGERALMPLEKLLGLRGIDRKAVERAKFAGHVVILGYGDIGRILMEKLDNQPFQVMCLEHNSNKVDESRARGHHVFYGDFLSLEALRHANLKNAAAVVLTSRDNDTSRKAVEKIRGIKRDLPLFIYNGGQQDIAAFRGMGSHLAVLNDLETLYLKVKRQGLFGAGK